MYFINIKYIYSIHIHHRELHYIIELLFYLFQALKTYFITNILIDIYFKVCSNIKYLFDWIKNDMNMISIVMKEIFVRKLKIVFRGNWWQKFSSKIIPIFEKQFQTRMNSYLYMMKVNSYEHYYTYLRFT